MPASKIESKGAIIQSFISEYCPHCRAEVEFRSGLFARNTIGPEKEKCPHCNEDYVTGRKEWAHMSEAENRDPLAGIAPDRDHGARLAAGAWTGSADGSGEGMKGMWRLRWRAAT